MKKIIKESINDQLLNRLVKSFHHSPIHIDEIINGIGIEIKINFVGLSQKINEYDLNVIRVQYFFMEGVFYNPAEHDTQKQLLDKTIREDRRDINSAVRKFFHRKLETYLGIKDATVITYMMN